MCFSVTTVTAKSKTSKDVGGKVSHISPAPGTLFYLIQHSSALAGGFHNVACLLRIFKHQNRRIDELEKESRIPE
ncbi:hypothetical protein AAHA92_21082 [Salvia divinorum]|uniref:Uncharacterized protein n=1 Tax=Salvia divinorum TaxID=28513 RepID=A0ABD1GJA3_SALDI